MLPANVPHAAFSLSSHFLYGQTFHVQGRARDRTTFALELSAGIKPEESMDRVLACYKEGLQDPDPRIRSIHIDYLLCTMPTDRIAMRQINRESYLTRLIAVLRDHRMFEGACGLCQYLGIAPQSDEDCCERHPLESEQQLSAKRRRLSHTKRTRSAISDPTYSLTCCKRRRGCLLTQGSRCEMPKEVCLATKMCRRAAMKQAYTAMEQAAIM
jgi:hypothetical protein